MEKINAMKMECLKIEEENKKEAEMLAELQYWSQRLEQAKKEAVDLKEKLRFFGVVEEQKEAVVEQKKEEVENIPVPVVEERKPVVCSKPEIDDDCKSDISRASVRSSRSSKSSTGVTCQYFIEKKGKLCGYHQLKSGTSLCYRHFKEVAKAEEEKKKDKKIEQVEDSITKRVNELEKVLSSQKGRDVFLKDNEKKSALKNAKRRFFNIYDYFSKSIPEPEALIEYFDSIEGEDERSKQICAYISVMRSIGEEVDDSLYQANTTSRIKKQIETEIQKTENQAYLRANAEKQMKKEEMIVHMEQCLDALHEEAGEFQSDDEVILMKNLKLYYAELIYNLFKIGMANRPQDIYRTKVVDFERDVEQNDATYNYFSLETNRWYITDSKTGTRVYDFRKGLIDNHKAPSIKTDNIIKVIEAFRDRYITCQIDYLVPNTKLGQASLSSLNDYFHKCFGEKYTAMKLRHIIGCDNYLNENITTDDLMISCMLLGHSIETQRGAYLSVILKEDSE